MKRSPLTIIIAALLMVIFGMMLFVFQVRQSEVAVITLWDKMEPAGTRSTPGPHLQWPWPIEKVYKLDQRVHSLENEDDKLDPVMLPDGNIILMVTYVGWTISDPPKFFQQFQDGSFPRAEKQLRDVVRTAKLEVAGHHNFSDFLSADPAEMKLTQIENEILANAVQKLQAGNYGIEIKFVQIKNIELPTSVSQAVFDRMKAQRAKLVSAISSSADAEAGKIKADADNQASRLLSDADAQALEIRGEGQLAIIQSLKVMDQNPTFAKFLMDLEMWEPLSKSQTTWIFDHNTTGLEFLQGIKTGGAGTNAAAGAAHN
jgi:membrane protease subunit HflC